MMSRPSYVRELHTVMTFPFALSLFEGGVIGVLAKNIFEVSGFGLATILAAPMFSNLTSFAWSMISRGRPKVRMISIMQAITLLCVASVAVLPTSGIGPALLVVLVVLMRCMMAGIVTIRSAIWRLNYPRTNRAKTTGRLALIASMVLIVAPQAFFLIDINDTLFRVVYPAAAAIGVIGLIRFAGLRVRREKELLNHERAPLAKPTPRGETGAVYEFDANAEPTREGFRSVLRRDIIFRRYMICQFLAGVANMAGETAAILLIIDMAKHQTPSMPNTVSVQLTVTLTFALAMISMPMWAKVLDQTHITSFRVRHGLTWISAQSLNWLAAYTGIIWVFVPARIMQGLARGGGLLAWQLGHNDFADRRLVSVYMGIHQTLTGMRGMVAPYLGTILLLGLPMPTVWGVPLPSLGGIGHYTFAVTTFIAVMSYLGYVYLHITLRRTGQAMVRDDA